MNAERFPEAVRLDPASDALPTGLDAVVTEFDPPVLLLVTSSDEAAAKAAIALAEGRVEAGHRTVLADMSGGTPRLHELLGVDNVEGMSDLLLYGASPARIRTRPPGRGFDFIPAGAYLPDDPALLDDDRWNNLAAGLRDDGAGMLLVATPSTPGLEALSQRLGQAVLMGDPVTIAESRDRIDPSCTVVAVVEPVEEASPVGAAGPGPADWVDAGEPAEVAADSDQPLVPQPEPEPQTERRPDPEPEPEELAVAPPEPEKRRAVSPVLWVLLILVLAVAAWFVYTEYLAAPAPTPAVSESTASPSTESGELMDAALPVSVAVAAHSDLTEAMERVEALRAAEPGIQFYLAPTDVEGVTYYRLLAGPVANREAGERLMGRLLDAGHITAAEAWAIEDTPLAFVLGEYDSAAAGAARVDSLAGLAIPSYVVRVRYEPGPVRYRVYGGAYETEAAASAMRRILSDAGVEAELAPRTGEPVVRS